MHINNHYVFTALGANKQPFKFAYPMTSEELTKLLQQFTDVAKVALIVLTPFEPCRDGSTAPWKQYPTGWALAHLRTLLRQYGKESYISNLKLLHAYLIAGGDVRNPIGMFTYRMRQQPIEIV